MRDMRTRSLCVVALCISAIYFWNLYNYSELILDLLVNTSYYNPRHVHVISNTSARLATVGLDACDVSRSQWTRQNAEDDRHPVQVTSHVWVPADTTPELFVYSAYSDDDDDDGTLLVRVIGIGLRTARHDVVCVVQMTVNSTCLETRPARVEIMPESHDLNYSAIFVFCNMTQGSKAYAVSITGRGHTQLKNRLLVNYPQPLRFTMTTCLPCIHSRYNNETEIIQSIELDQILGVEHFVVYDYSIGSKVQRVLTHYSKKGIMDVRAWNLPNVLVHYLGQLAAINDCVYSNRGQSKYVVVKDLDEILVPYKDKTLPLLINKMVTDSPLTSAVMFRSTFFVKNWPDDTEGYKDAKRAKQLSLYMLLKIGRDHTIWNTKHRSKMVYIPERVEISGIHHSWKLRKGYTEIEVPPAEGLVHHYRQCRAYKPGPRVNEDFVRIYSEQLIDRFNTTLRLLHNKR